MTDIVRRLREPPFGTETSERNLMIAAADEITRLRNELHIAEVWSARVIAGTQQDTTEIARLRAENERLRGQAEFEKKCRNDAFDELKKQDAEIERLQEALRPLAGMFLYPDDLGYEASSDIKEDLDWDDDANDMNTENVFVLRRDIRRARAVLEPSNE